MFRVQTDQSNRERAVCLAIMLILRMHRTDLTRSPSAQVVLPWECGLHIGNANFAYVQN
jgi:hypothetical protein